MMAQNWAGIGTMPSAIQIKARCKIRLLSNLQADNFLISTCSASWINHPTHYHQKRSWCTRIHCRPIHWNIFSLERDFIFGLNNLSSADDWHKNHSRIIDGYEKNAFQHQKTRNVQWCQGVPLQHVLKNDVHKKELIFCKSLKGINGIIEGWLIVGVTTMWREDSTHPTRHAPYQGPQPNRPQGNRSLLHSHTQLCCCSWRIIHVTNIDQHLAPKVFYEVHIRTFGWPIHDFHGLVLH